MEKMMRHDQETIAAICTPIGQGGIAVVRVSGGEAIGICDRLFRGKKKLSECQSHTVHFGLFVGNDGSAVDEVIATIFKAPNSYTGEDTVELSCHGGQFVARRLLEEVTKAGARLAEPGEFTKRAFLNGRIDLAQAEAVADLISAQSERAHRVSLAQLTGWLSREIETLRERLIDVLGLMELELDFSEEGIELIDPDRAITVTQDALEKVEKLLKSFGTGRIYREGVSVVLVGLPNVGKSSLLNAILNRDRAIVTPIPGTTRDVIEESVTINGILFRLSDTAGVRATEDIVEKEGVTRTNQKIEEADIVVMLFDSERGIRVEEMHMFEELRHGGKRIIPVINKIDLQLPDKGVKDLLQRQRVKTLEISALRRIGIDSLMSELVEVALAGTNGSAYETGEVISNLRHARALEKAKFSLESALESMRDSRSEELVALDLRAAVDSLGEIVGKVTTDEILENIFSKFCIGK
jgi:tRNA modification GTPase